MEKKKWEKPELVVLVRGKPEEMVLQKCKRDAFGTGAEGPGVDYDGCINLKHEEEECDDECSSCIGS